MKTGVNGWCWMWAALIACNAQCDAQISSRLGGVQVTSEGAVIVRPGLASRPKVVARHSTWRVLSLRAIAVAAENQRTTKIGRLPHSLQRMNGIDHVEFIFVVGGGRDVLLVGRSSGSPSRLEYLVDAVRAQRAKASVSCSIEPRPDGLARLQAWLSSNRVWNSGTTKRIEQQLGPQSIIVTGTSADSLTARVMVLADYDMKRLSMGMVRFSGMPSYPRLAGKKAEMFPRWWITCRRPAIGVNPAGNIYQLPATTWHVESAIDDIDGQGRRVASRGMPASAAADWAKRISAFSSRLDTQVTTFVELRQVMQASLIAQLLHQVVEGDVAAVLAKLHGGQRPAVRAVPTRATTKRIRSSRLVLASGGVTLPRWDMEGCLTTPRKMNIPFKLPAVPSTYDTSSDTSVPYGIVICFDCSQSVRLLHPRRQRYALSRVLDQLPRQSSFNLLAFNDRNGRCWRESVPATDVNKARASGFARKFPCRPVTDIYTALRSVLVDSPEEVHLISDGVPDGVVWDAKRTLARLAADRVPVPIHTWCTSTELKGRAFMRRVSQISGGRAWLVSWTDGKTLTVRRNE